MTRITALGIAAGLVALQTLQAHIPAASPRNGHRQTFWPNGHLRSEVTYLDDAYDGEYRTWYQGGAPYELRHYANGREAGVQQSWTESGELFLNYEVRDGRRFGLVNAAPCVTVGEAAEPESEPAPYYDDRDFTPRWSPVAHRVAPFELRTQSGAAISERSLDGRIYVASFIFTRCAAVCPIVVRQLTRVQSALADIPNARIVSFSVTPDVDTPEALAAFGRTRGIDPSRWSLLTGDKDQIYRLARESYFADDNRADPAAEGSGEAFLHTEKLVLVDANRRLRGVYNGTQPHDVDLLIEDIGRLAAKVER